MKIHSNPQTLYYGIKQGFDKFLNKIFFLSDEAKAPFHKEFFERQNGFSAPKILLMGCSVNIPVS